MTHLSFAAADEIRPAREPAGALLRILPGHWDGRAVETPVGSMPYDMHFHACDDGSIAGVARPGASLHYWKFTLHEEDLRIRFLSTFAGNRTPILLTASPPEDASLYFLAPELGILTLRITYSGARIDIRVFHHHLPHVHIRLSKSASTPEPLSPHHSRSNSCRGSPAE